MKPVRLSAQAEADLEAIADFIAKEIPSGLRASCSNCSRGAKLSGNIHIKDG